MIPINDPDIHRRERPLVTYALVAINVVVWLYQSYVITDLDEFIFTFQFGVIPAELLRSVELGTERLRLDASIVSVDLTSPIPTWATVFSSMFLHGGFLHLAGNMVFLWVFGDNVEDRFGRVRFLTFYLIAGVAAVFAQAIIDPESTVPMIGASGAIAGVLGAYLVLFPYSRVDTLFFVGLVFHARLAAVWLIGAWVLLQAFNGVGSLGASSAGSGVAYFAHLGGFAAGLVIAVLYKLARREPIMARRRRWPPG